VQPVWRRVLHNSRVSFNPHPPVGAGATCTTRTAWSATLFQSSPARGGGCNRDDLLSHVAPPASVSILTRPWGRVQHPPTKSSLPVSPFQSSPARGGGCNRWRSPRP